MIVNHAHYSILSANTDLDNRFWEQDLFPDWSILSGFAHLADIPAGRGVEPHYHGCDEFWLFTHGKGELWLDNHLYEITPQTVVYTPMGVVHRFQFFTPGAGVAPLVTRLEGRKQSGHLVVEDLGPPVPTVPGFVVPGVSNTGPFQHRGPRRPLDELRHVVLAPGERVAAGPAFTLEYWLATQGELQLTTDDTVFKFLPGDLAILRAGTVRTISSSAGAQVFLARE